MFVSDSLFFSFFILSLEIFSSVNSKTVLIFEHFCFIKNNETSNRNCETNENTKTNTKKIISAKNFFFISGPKEVLYNFAEIKTF